MHTTLAEILENQKSGLLWVSQDGVVRYANGDACSRTGLAAGGKLYDPDLARAVMQAVLHRASAAVNATGRPGQPGEPAPELRCRVVPDPVAGTPLVVPVGRHVPPTARPYASTGARP